MEVRKTQNVRKKVPQFNHIRRLLYKDNTPEVKLEIAFKNKETEEVSVVKDVVTPKSRFPPNQFEKLYETAAVKVNKF